MFISVEQKCPDGDQAGHEYGPSRYLTRIEPNRERKKELDIAKLFRKEIKLFATFVMMVKSDLMCATFVAKDLPEMAGWFYTKEFMIPISNGLNAKNAEKVLSKRAS